MGILTGILGFLTTLAALNSFADTCFRELSPAVSALSIDKKAGAAFIMLLVATVLKVVDIIAHLIVPVPKQNYWTPTGAGADDDSDYNVEVKNRKFLETVSPSSV